MAMLAAIAYRKTKSRSTNERSGKWSEERSRGWIFGQCEESNDHSVRISIRSLMSLWGWSSFAVRNLLDRMEEVGQISRKVLPMNGGTLITMASQQAVGDDETGGAGCLGAGVPSPVNQMLQNLPLVLSSQEIKNLSRVYEAIIYGQPGYGWATIEHLEKIERALFPIQMQQAA